jgi:hypothetical protein
MTVTRQNYSEPQNEPLQAISETGEVCISVIAALIWRRGRKRNRHLQVYPTNERRPEFVVVSYLYSDLLQGEYRLGNYFRMCLQPVRPIIVLVRKSVMKQNTVEPPYPRIRYPRFTAARKY